MTILAANVVYIKTLKDTILQYFFQTSNSTDSKNREKGLIHKNSLFNLKQ